jgi:hypothetical protein
MSNRSLHERMVCALAAYRRGALTVVELREVFALNGRALEAMPDTLAHEFGNIDHLLTLAQWTEEEDCVPDVAEALGRMDKWLAAIPMDA